MQKLIKLNPEHYIIVDDSEIKEGDWMIRNGEQPTLVTPNFWWDFGVPYKKITHSTQPLEEGTTIHGIEHKRWVYIKYIDLSEVKELIGEVDVEKKAHDWFMTEKFISSHIADIKSFVAGYNQALEDNKEKKYTEEDLRIALVYGYERGREGDFTSEQEEEFYKYLQPKTEWEIEIVDGKLKLK